MTETTIRNMLRRDWITQTKHAADITGVDSNTNNVSLSWHSLASMLRPSFQLNPYPNGVKIGGYSIALEGKVVINAEDNKKTVLQPNFNPHNLREYLIFSKRDISDRLNAKPAQ